MKLIVKTIDGVDGHVIATRTEIEVVNESKALLHVYGDDDFESGEKVIHTYNFDNVIGWWME